MKKLLSFCLALLLLAGLAVIPTSAETITPDTAWYGDGAQDRFELKTAADVLGFFKLLSAGTASFEGKTVALTADVDLNPGWKASELKNNPKDGYNTVLGVPPQNSFKGTFDGQGHTIKGLSAILNQEETGLFGQAVKGADVTIRNIRFVNSLVDQSSRKNCTGLMNNKGGNLTIENVYSEIIAYGKSDTGSFSSAFTANYDAPDGVTVIRNCVFAGKHMNVQGGSAPFIARNDGTATLENCAFYGSVESPTNNCSGLVHDNRGTLTIKNCISAGTVTANSSGNTNSIIMNPAETYTSENNLIICDGTVAAASMKGAKVITADDLKDFYNYAKDIEGFEGWDVIGDKAYPTTLAWGIKGTNSDAVCLKSWQKSDVKDDGTWSVRLIGGVDSLDYDSLELCLTVKDNEGKTGTVKESTQTVWSSILAGEETITAESLKTGYLWGVVLSNIPEAQNAIGLDAKVYTVKDGIKTLVSVQTVLVGGAEQ